MARYIKTITKQDRDGFDSLDMVTCCKAVIWKIQTASSLNFGDIIYLYIGGENHRGIEYRGVIVDILKYNKNNDGDKEYTLYISFAELDDSIKNELDISHLESYLNQRFVARQAYLFKEEGPCKPIFDNITRLEKEYYFKERKVNL